MRGYQNELVQIKEALKVNPRGMTISEISREINVNRNSVAKYLDVMLISGQVEMRLVGRAKLYFISQRVPLSTMLNLSSEYIMVFNREYRMVQVNDAFLDLLNIEREAIIGKKLKDAPSYIFNKPYFRSGLKKGFDGIDSSKELSFQIRDAELYLRIKFIPTTFDDGEQGVTIIMENITERKKAERALQESEERFRELADLLPQTVYETDERGNLTFANRIALEKFRYTQKDLEKGLNVIQTIIPEDRDRSRKNVQRILSGEELSSIEYTALRKDGSTFPMLIFSSPIIRGNKPTGLRGIAIDITERKLMEEELRDSEGRFRELAESISDTFFAMDGNLRYTYWNEASEKLTGIKSEDAIGKSIFEIFPDREDTRRAITAYQRVLQTRQPETFVNEFQLGGKDYFFEISAYPTKDGVSVFVKDITERKRMEEELREVNWSLKERVKELTCLYGIARLVEQSVRDLEGILEGIVSLIPPAWKYPEVTCARIIVDEQIFKTDNFKDTEWRQAADIKVSGEALGTVEVYYLEEKPDSYEGPFLKEERDLIDDIAERLGRIIERKRMEEELKRSEKKYRQLIENALEGVWVIDSEAKTTFVNSRMAEMLGYTEDEMIGKQLFSFMDERGIELATYYLERRKKGIKEIHDFEFLRKNGTRVYTRLTTSPIIDEKGNYKGAFAFVTDITERKKMEEALRASEAKYSSVVENTRDGVVIIQDEVLKFVNTASVELVKYTPEELIGINFLNMVSPEHRETVMKRYADRIAGKDIPSIYETSLLRKDGATLPVEVNAALIDYEGRPADLVFIRDITERKLA